MSQDLAPLPLVLLFCTLCVSAFVSLATSHPHRGTSKAKTSPPSDHPGSKTRKGTYLNNDRPLLSKRLCHLRCQHVPVFQRFGGPRATSFRALSRCRCSRTTRRATPLVDQPQLEVGQGKGRGDLHLWSIIV